MAKFNTTLDMGLKYTLNFIRVPAFTTVAIPRVEFAHFCRYSRVIYNIIK